MRRTEINGRMFEELAEDERATSYARINGRAIYGTSKFRSEDGRTFGCWFTLLRGAKLYTFDGSSWSRKKAQAFAG